MPKIWGQIKNHRSGCYITPTFLSWMFSFYENRLCNLSFLYSIFNPSNTSLLSDNCIRLHVSATVGHHQAWWWPTVAEICSLIQLSDNKNVLDWLNILYCYNTSGWITSYYLFFILMKCHLINLWSTVPQVSVLTKKQLGNRITIANLSQMERILVQLCLPVLGKYGSCCHIRWTDSKFYMKNPRWCNSHNISLYFKSQPTSTLRTNLSDSNVSTLDSGHH
jgi:hypothetical protein